MATAREPRRRVGRPPGRTSATLLTALSVCLGLWPVRSTYPETEPRPERRVLQVGGAELRVHLVPEAFDLPEQALLGWVETSARAVSSFYGQFPAPAVSVHVRPASGRGVKTGRTTSWNGLEINVVVGRASGLRDLDRDWVMTHEMVHLALPSVGRKHHWLEEGLATYVEPLARLEIGEVGPEKVWLDLVRGLPNGLPRRGDRGLDHTPTWGRTYWGGALFCLLADIQIREQTENQKGLRDALRAINAEGGNMNVHWSIEKVLRVGDEATGVPVLQNLYDRMKNSPQDIDLDDLWSRLGVRDGPRGIQLEARAPLAWIRRGIAPLPVRPTAPESPESPESPLSPGSAAEPALP